MGLHAFGKTLFACACIVSLAARADIAQVVLDNTTGTAINNAPFTLGHVFSPGDLAAGQPLSARLGDGSQIPLQLNVKTSHGDGSVRHAIVSGRVPLVDGNRSQTLTLYQGGSAPNGTAVTIANVLATSFDVTVTLNVAGTTYGASARDLLQSGARIDWLSGPLVSEWVVTGPLETGSGTDHPHLTAQFEVRAYGNPVTHVRVGVAVENNWTAQPNAQTFNYDVTVSVDGSGQVLSQNDVPHYRQSRWRRAFWWGDDPSLHIQHDARYLMSSGAVPAYDPNITISGSTVDDMVAEFIERDGDALMGIGALEPDMTSAGGRMEIAPLPRFAVRWLLSQDVRARQVMLGYGEQAGSWPMHYREQATGLPVSLDTYPNISILGESSTPPTCDDCGSPYEPEVSHHPSMAFLPYLITGDYYFLEETQFWGNWVLFYGSAVRHGGAQGLVVWDQLRGQAWAMRTLGQAAYATPDAHPLKNYFLTKLANNISYYNANWVDATPLGFMMNTGAAAWLDFPKIISTWMDDFVTWSFGYLVSLGFTDARPMLDWKAKFPAGRMAGDGSCYILASTSWLAVTDDFFHGGSGNPVDTWNEWRVNVIRDHSGAASGGSGSFRGTDDITGREQALIDASCDSREMADILGLPQGVMIGYQGSEGTPANIQPALAVAVDAEATNAAEAWSLFTASKSYPNYDDEPQWGIVPASELFGPTVFFFASPNLVDRGTMVTLNWSTGASAVLCEAGGDWSGEKGTDGSERVGPVKKSRTYTLTCTDDRGDSNTRTVAVNVIGEGGGSGGNALSPLVLLALLLCRSHRRP